MSSQPSPTPLEPPSEISVKVLEYSYFTLYLPTLYFTIISFCFNLPRYHLRVAFIVLQIIVVLMNRKLSDRLVN